MKFNKTVLPNGLRLITVPMPDNPAVTVLVMVETGSKYEVKEKNGLSHFLEHMVFKGTPRRPRAIDISRELDSIGAHYNAFTTQEFTGYYAKAASRHLETVLDIVSDMYQNPLFEEVEINKEKGVIVEELRMYQDLPQQRVRDLFMELLYGDQPAGWNIGGTESNVRSFVRQDFLDYRAKHYVAGATTVVVSGSFDETKLVELVKGSFAGISAGPKGLKLPVQESQTAPLAKTDFKETDQTHLVLGVRTFSVSDPRIPVMHVLSTILGRGMSSRLFSKMRDQLGICYYIRTDHEVFTDHGVLAIGAGLDNARVEEGIKGIISECDRLKKEIVSPEEMKKAKDYLAGTTLLELETSDSRAEFAGFQEALKHTIELPEEIIAKVGAVTAEQVQSLAKEIFVDPSLNLAVAGRFKDDLMFKNYLRFP